jgi:hypothetical protein
VDVFGLVDDDTRAQNLIIEQREREEEEKDITVVTTLHEDK